MKKFLLSIAMIVLVCTSCGGRNAKNAAAGSTERTAAPEIYPVPQIPTMLDSQEQKLDWMAVHYWDNFDFVDTTTVAGWSDYAEQAFVDYGYHLLPNIPAPTAQKSLDTFFGKAATNKVVFVKFEELAEKYLFDPNSPTRNEEVYIMALNSILASPLLDQWEKIAPAEQLRMALKNRRGELSADFRYTLASGASGTLHGLKATYTLLFFNNPGCPACREMIDQVMGSPFLARLIDEGTLVVLAVYTDEDMAAWREYLPNMPAGWISSYDATRTIKNDELYDLKAIPTIYLLDKNKKVMLKDVMSIPLIEETIYNNQQPK